ncbi:MAG: hypothetical protein Q8P67_25840, partial [archaeon]|nr:hypothetical protein [archaeon]
YDFESHRSIARRTFRVSISLPTVSPVGTPDTIPSTPSQAPVFQPALPEEPSYPDEPSLLDDDIEVEEAKVAEDKKRKTGSSPSAVPSAFSTFDLFSTSSTFPADGGDGSSFEQQPLIAKPAISPSVDPGQCCQHATAPGAENNLEFLNAPFIEPQAVTFTPRLLSESVVLDKPVPDPNYTLRTVWRRIRAEWIKDIGWSGRSTFEKITFVCLSPFSLMLNLSIPYVEDESWDKCLAVLNPIFAPFVICLGFEGYGISVGGLPLWALLFIIGLALSVLVMCFTSLDHKPQQMHLFLTGAFVISVLWIYLLADELVAVLQSIGVVLSIPPAILGLTVLAWGNSTGDLINNLAVARQGYPGMALAAAFGNPMFNILLGFGIPMLITTIVIFPAVYPMSLNPSLTVGLCFLAIGLVTSLFTIPMADFTIPKKFGAYLIIVYSIQTVISVLTETGAIFF